MQYRRMEKLNLDVSIFGIGLMRLETGPGGQSDILYDKSTPLIHRAIDMGVNYIDTAFFYHGGFSEVSLGKALKARPSDRKRIKIATKLPIRDGEGYEDWEKYLNTSLERIGTDYVDFYLVHGINYARIEPVKDELFRFLEDMKKKGKIIYPSASFHGDYDDFIKLVDSYDWSMLQVQQNILDVYNQCTLKGMQYAGSKGIPIVVMEPLRGGVLVRHVPDEAKKLYDEFSVKRKPVEWAFRYVYNQPEVKVILSGIGNMEELEENVEIFSRSAPGVMSADELKLVDDVRLAYESLAKIGCTACRYCEPGCPMEIPISDILRGYDQACIMGATGRFQARYDQVTKDKNGAGTCIECGNCESVCPQSIQIIRQLAFFSDNYERA
ncbi:MAG: aldo/keto reductase [Christensenellales bacterium]|jgi:predicted aldo/keto reductase-like oxidoreductase